MTITSQIDLGYSGSRQTLSFESDSAVWLTYMKDRAKVSLAGSRLQGTWVVVSVSRSVDSDRYKITVWRVQ